MGFSRQEYWSRLPFPPLEDNPDLGIKPVSPASPELAGVLFTAEPPRKPLKHINNYSLDLSSEPHIPLLNCLCDISSSVSQKTPHIPHCLIHAHLPQIPGPLPVLFSQ